MHNIQWRKSAPMKLALRYIKSIYRN